MADGRATSNRAANPAYWITPEVIAEAWRIYEDAERGFRGGCPRSATHSRQALEDAIRDALGEPGCVDAPLRGADRPRGHDVDAEDGRSDA